VNNVDVPSEWKEGLLEDSLKMPFTVFSTKQKQKMIKLLEVLRGDSSSISNSNNKKENECVLSVIDIDNDTAISLMNDDTGDTYDVELPQNDLGSRIKKAFETTDDAVTVKCRLDDHQTVREVLDICI